MVDRPTSLAATRDSQTEEQDFNLSRRICDLSLYNTYSPESLETEKSPCRSQGTSRLCPTLD